MTIKDILLLIIVSAIAVSMVGDSITDWIRAWRRTDDEES